jgi:hypothetical protein
MLFTKLMHVFSLPSILNFLTIYFLVAKQLCLSVSIPTELGGIGGEAIFVDTEGSFVVSRFALFNTSVLDKRIV